MQCTSHPEREAVDVCRQCGKAVCTSCSTRPEASSVCESCLPPTPVAAASPALESPAVASAPQRSPLRAALLSILPGLGQLYNGQPLKGLAFICSFVLLVFGVSRAATLGPFIGVFWLYQVVEAFCAASAGGTPRNGERAAPAPDSGRVGFGLLAAGVLLLVETTTGLLFQHGRILVPALVIAAGLYLLLSYFRASERAAT